MLYVILIAERKNRLPHFDFKDEGAQKPGSKVDS